MDKYQKAKKKVSDLKDDEYYLQESLKRAIAAGEAGEIARLRKRQTELPGEIAEAELEFTSVKVASLRAEQVEAKQELERARIKSKETDERVEAELKELNAKRKALSDDRYARLAYVYRLNDSILNRAREIQAAELELKNRLERAA
jgi:hypothetical protein